jgi:hypothetical protein
MQRLWFCFLLGVCAYAGAASPQTRYVVINGQRLTDPQIAYLDQVQCARIPNGRYWLNLATGAWGYAGNPIVRGYLGDLCSSQRRHKSLSERGLLYTPGDLNFR